MGSPVAPAWQGLLWALFLLLWPGCQAEVQVSVPEVMEVLLGDRVSIFCTHTVTGEDSFLLVEWFITDKNGEQRRVAYSDRGQQGVDRGTEYTDRVSMDSSHSLVIHAADVTDERPFSCQVTSGAAGSGMGETQLKVYDPPEPPELTHDSRILSVTEKHASEIATCSSRNAIPVPTITWYKDGHLLNASSDHNKELYTVSRTVKEASGLYSVSNTLYLRLNKADKDSKFQCRVNYSMPHGKVGNATSEAFQVTLHYYTENVEFALDPPQVIKEGDTVQLRCTSDGYPPPEYIFARVQTNDVSEDLGSNSEGILLLQHVTKADSGTYRCQVLDFDSPPEVELEKEVTIFVNFLDPLVLHPTETATAELGGNLELSCAGTGSKTPILSWRKDKEHVADGGQLTLQSLTYHMAGTYKCEASVPSIPGLRREQSVEVIVEGVPQMEQRQSMSHYDHLGQTVKLMCSALGYPKPEIMWSVPGLEEDMKTVANGVIGELSVEVTPELVQSGVKCEAHNKHGTAEQLFQFQIVAPTMPASPGSAVDGEETQGGSMVAVIAVCVCVLILLLIVAFFYFMQRRGQLPCGGGEKRSLTPKEGSPDDTVVEMKTDKRNEQTGLLSHGGGGGGGGGGGTNEC